MTSTSNHSASRWECIEPPSVTAVTVTPPHAKRLLPPLQRRAPIVVSKSIPACPQRQLSRDMVERFVKDTTASTGFSPKTPVFPPTTPRSGKKPPYPALSPVPVSPCTPPLEISFDIPVGRLSKTLAVHSATSQAPMCPVRRQSPSPRHPSISGLIGQLSDRSSISTIARASEESNDKKNPTLYCSSNNNNGPACQPVLSTTEGMPPCPPICTPPSASSSQRKTKSSKTRTMHKLFQRLSKRR